MAKSIRVEGKRIRAVGRRGIHKAYKIREKHRSVHARATGRQASERGPLKLPHERIPL